MSEAHYESLRQLLSQSLQAELATGKPPSADYIRTVATGLKASEEVILRLVTDLCAPESLNEVAVDAAPFLLIRLGEDLRPGAHLSPEFHLLHANWGGEVSVEATIHGPLDRQGWDDRPRLTDERGGYWIFHQALSLTVNGAPCSCGEYRLNFECRFHSSTDQSDSTWHGWIRFRVVDKGASEQTLEVVSDGQGLVNLHGLDLKRFNRLRFEARDNSLINLQSFLAAMEQATLEPSQQDSRPSMIPVKLRPQEDKIGVRAVPRPNRLAQLYLPSGRRVLLFAQDRVMLGRNRPHSAVDDPTDIALRMMPRSEFHDSLTRNISQQHLSVSVADGRVTLSDPRRADSRSRFPAFVNQAPLGDARSVPHSSRPITFYTTTLGERLSATEPPPQIGLEVQTFAEPDISREVLSRLPSPRHDSESQQAWLRELAGMDAVLMERTANSDKLNRLEAYLLVLGVVLIGRDERCPIRLDGPGVRDSHAVLCHWDGQFRVLPIEDADVRCGNRHLNRGECGTLTIGSTLRLGEVELRFDKPLQFGLP